ncbi:hypothetical protein EV368DRAFT_70143 [Lentinula lateritia]|nr:hypothetical protein EV368DRAFT_70143 [Lentinula lateritia]
MATKFNITKGQRGTVYLWQCKKGKHGQTVLDVLFVELNNPPLPIQIQHLQPNVVPIIRRENKGYVYLPDDTKIDIARNQVDILLGFAMTAHASQGQSLLVNTTDLNTLDGHHAYYTALSRSKSYHNTAILQGFDTKYITGGASGALQKEFRELELLDKITQLRYESKCDNTVQEITRLVLIELFRKWKGTYYNPPLTHTSIRWSAKDPYVVEQHNVIPWSIIASKTKEKSVTVASKAKITSVNSAPLLATNTLKRKATEANLNENGKSPSKKVRHVKEHSIRHLKATEPAGPSTVEFAFQAMGTVTLTATLAIPSSIDHVVPSPLPLEFDFAMVK